MSYPFDCDDLRAAGDDARKRKREEAMFPPRVAAPRVVSHDATTPAPPGADVGVQTQPAVAAPWISVKERLPDSEGSYFVRVGRYHQPLVAKYARRDGNDGWDCAWVTHWMEIPELDK